MIPKTFTRLVAFLFFFIAGVFAMADQPPQGLEGHVYRIRGNQMPSPDRKPSAPKGIKTTLYIFELTNLNQVTRKGQSTFYTQLTTKLIKKVQTDSSGYFSVHLPAARYSLFVKLGDAYYANWFDAEGNIAPAQVDSNKLTNVIFKIDYDAAY
jgi:hypothetical protein